MSRRYAIVRSLVVGFSVAGLALVACSDSSKEEAQLAKLAAPCTLNSECRAPLVCTFQRCHEQCSDSRDCPTGQRCVRATASNGVCQLPVEASCKKTLDCVGYSQTCAEDGKCHDLCASESNCLGAEQCTSSGACADVRELDADGNLMSVAEGGGSGEGSGGGGKGGSGGTGGSGARGAAGGSAGSEAGSGGSRSNVGGTSNEPGAGDGQGAVSGAIAGEAGADGTPCPSVQPNGKCSYCPLGACDNGDCVSGKHDYSCDCWPGFSGTGTKQCQLDDPCSANLTCTAAYPCVPTPDPGGYSCVGQFATWPMPDREIGGAVTPSYSGTVDTVVDQLTSLEWQRGTTNDCSLPDSDAGATPCDSSAGAAYCAALTLGGESGWRLPSAIELESLLDCTHSFKPLIDTTAFPSTTDGVYLTASTLVGNGQIRAVNFDTCASQSTYGVNSVSVRCVRGNGLRGSTAKDHYSVTTDDSSGGAGGQAAGDVVVDNWTGLTWQRSTADVEGFSAAQSACVALGSGFRMPTVKELSTLVDPQGWSPTIDAAAFPGTPSSAFWTSTPFQPAGGQYWAVDFSNGATANTTDNVTHTLRCVRF